VDFAALYDFVECDGAGVEAGTFEFPALCDLADFPALYDFVEYAEAGGGTGT